MKSPRDFKKKRLMNAMRQAHADGWFIVFDTLTLADDRIEAFYDNPNALRDYFRDIGRMVLAAEGRKANDSHADCYQYFCVPEYVFVSGRRRHTACSRDWSSDVCSSDLMDAMAVQYARELALWGIETSIIVPGAFTGGTNHFAHSASPADKERAAEYEAGPYKGYGKKIQIGRASCRERV